MKRILALMMTALLLCGSAAGEGTAHLSEMDEARNTIRYSFTDEAGLDAEDGERDILLEMEYSDRK